MADAYVGTSIATLETMDDEVEDASAVGQVAAYVHGRWTVARDHRRPTEDKWYRAYLNYRGEYHPDLQFRDTEESRVFIKVTKTKVVAAYGMITEIMFPNNSHQFPVFIQPTPVPEYVEDMVHFDPKAAKEPPAQGPSSAYGFPGDGNDLKPGDTHSTLSQRFGALTAKLSQVVGLKKGPGVKPGDATFHPAQKTADNMNRKMQDQFLEGGAHAALEYAGFESSLLGTGIIRGPFSVTKEYPHWEPAERKGLAPVYKPVRKAIPTYEHITDWDFYPDPDATTERVNWCVVRRRVDEATLYGYKDIEGYRVDSIARAIEAGPNYQEEWWEKSIRDDDNTHSQTDLYVAHEYWGTMKVSDILAMVPEGIDIPSEFDDDDMLKVTTTVCNGETLKFIVNPYRPQREPFHYFLYERNPYSFWGIGIAENMDDTQTLMNGFMRLSVENAALSGNVILGVQEDALTAGQDLKLHPGKILRLENGTVGDAFKSIKIDNVANENLQLFDVARRLADESSGMPSFAHGQTGIQGVGRTASGISQLMGAAGTTMKPTIRNFNMGLQTMGEAQFHWNMQREYDEETHGDLQVKVRGTDAMMSREVRTQRTMTLMQVAGANPAMAPHV